MTPNPKAMLPDSVGPWLARQLWKREGYVVELGSGHGSEALARWIQPAKLISVEHDPKYLNLVEGVEYIFAPIVDGWYDGVAIQNGLRGREPILALVVDGPPGKIGRTGLLDNLDLFPKHVPMVIDDVHRQAELDLAMTLLHRYPRGELVMKFCPGRTWAYLGFVGVL